MSSWKDALTWGIIYEMVEESEYYRRYMGSFSERDGKFYLVGRDFPERGRHETDVTLRTLMVIEPATAQGELPDSNPLWDWVSGYFSQGNEPLEVECIHSKGGDLITFIYNKEGKLRIEKFSNLDLEFK